MLGLRALWWRRGASLAVLAAATLAVVAAAIGPLSARTAEESLVRTRLSDTPVSEAGYAVARAANSTESAQPIPPVTAEQAVTTEAALPERIDGYFERPQIMLATDDLSVVQGQVRTSGRLVWRDGQCENLALDGTCPRTPDEVLLTRRSAIALGVEIGDQRGCRCPGTRRQTRAAPGRRTHRRAGCGEP